MSLLEIFDIYLKQAYNSTYILENGSFEFIKCIGYYLQYSYHIHIYRPSEYILEHDQVKESLLAK